ncbi:acyloxyacyl hydrolase [Photobacterium atrarenae]|uniref:Acyloxyacyl hydrolase n=1 Tax=Photobacterium atrarenae TaxID=865757 RepID=A0ABY5GML8_9GAMM|nr:acyloxyacyl hydrolase [Photobacterium atrarenae]UTV30562.1 acyloxyacyl hydrolase [Photobacterium atrarenae]
MLRAYLCAIAVSITPGLSSAATWLNSIEIGTGKSFDHDNVYRISLQRHFDHQWIPSKTGFLSGYLDVSYSHWKNGHTDKNGNNNVYALSPVFSYVFHTPSPTSYLFIEAGIGASYLSEHSIGDLNFGGQFQFEDRLGIGAQHQSWRVSFRLFHFSNADIYDSNDGIDLWLVSLQYLFIPAWSARPQPEYKEHQATERY